MTLFFSVKLTRGHHQYCGWTDNSCPLSFQSFQPEDEEDTRKKFAERVTDMWKVFTAHPHLLGLRSNLTSILERESVKWNPPGDTYDKLMTLAMLCERSGLKLPQSVECIVAMLKDGGTSFLSQISLCASCDSIDPTISGSSSLLILAIWAIFGWTAARELPCVGEEITLCCNTCGRTAVSDLSGLINFDFIREHRYFCPWISGAEGKLIGWIICATAVCGTDSAVSVSGNRKPDIFSEEKTNTISSLSSREIGSSYQCFSDVLRMIASEQER